jgi:hypothetical protein
MKSISMLMVALSMLVLNIAAADEHAATKPSSQPAQASSAAATRNVTPGRTAKLAKMSCEDLMTFDQVSRPQHVYFSEGHMRCDQRHG